MADNGYGYSNYQNSAARQPNTNPTYPAARQVTAPTSSSHAVYQNSSREYGRTEYDWQGQDISNMQGPNGSQGGSYWMSSNDAANQTSTYHRYQMPYQNTDLTRESSSHQYQGQSQRQVASQASSAVYNQGVGGASSRSSARPQNTYYPQNLQQNQNTNRPQAYRSSPIPHEAISRPDSAQSSRNAAATAMTALSSSITSRPYPQNVTSGLSPTYSANQLTGLGGNMPSILSNHTERHELDLRSISTAALRHETDQSRMPVDSPRIYGSSNRSTTSVSMVPQHTMPEHTHTRPTSTSAHMISNTNSQSVSSYAGSTNTRPSPNQVSTSMPYTEPTPNQYNARSNVIHVDNSSTTNMSTDASPSPPLPESTQTSFPTFVDPSQIYYPLSQEYERAKAAQVKRAAAEAKRAQALEAEGKTQREQQQQQQQWEKEQEEQGQQQEQQQTQAPQPAGVHNQPKLSPKRRKSTSLSTPKANDKSQPEKPKRKPRQRKSESAATSKAGGKKAARPSENAPSTNTTTTGGSGKDDEATEMMRMFEMMREKNPDLFQKMVADMKGPTSDARPRQNSEQNSNTANRGNPPAARQKRTPKDAVTESAVAQTPMPAQRSVATPAQAAPASGPANPPAKWKAVHAKEAPVLDAGAAPLPDLGKFPAARRKRGPRASTKKRLHTVAEPTIGPEVTEEERIQMLANFVNSDQPPAEAETAAEAKKPESQPRTQSQPLPLPLPQSQSQSQTSQPPTKDSGIWPHSKRQILSEAAAQYLSSLPGNESKVVTPTFLLSLIDQNPSYIQLCELLEARSYTLNRVHFAKHLLKAMPDLSENSQTSDKETPKNQAQPAPSQAASSSFVSPNSPSLTRAPSVPPSESKPIINSLVNPPTPDGNNPRAGGMPQPTPSSTGATGAPFAPPPSQKSNSGSKINSTAPSDHPPHVNGRALSLNNGSSQLNDGPDFSDHPMAEGPPLSTIPDKPPTFLQFQNRRSSGPIRPDRRLNPKLRVPAPKAPKSAPNSKEAQARKRNFSDIVDLTQQLSDSEGEETEGPVPPEKTPRLDIAEGTSNATIDGPSVPTITPFGDLSMAENTAPTTENVPQTQVSPEPQPPKTIDFSQYALSNPRQNVDRDQLRRRGDIVKPIVGAKALVRSYYDPRTVARDILIATGRHPTERGLNHHLLKLREKFTHVNNSADLETFRWDLVDPGGPPPPQVAAIPLVTRPALPSRAKKDRLGNQTSHDETSDAPTAKQPSQPAERPPPQVVIVNDDSDRTVDMPDTMATLATHTPEIPRRRGPGRPPGVKNKTTPNKKIQKPPKQTRVSFPDSSSSQPSRPFGEYDCHWDNCWAKLHNLPVFRKHVMKLHVPKRQANTACLWKGCKSSQTFSAADLADHLDREHMSPTAWKLGDGPTAIGSGFLSMDYETCLYDEDGRSIVAKASTNGAPPSLILPAAYVSIREFNKMHGYQNDRSKALEVMRSLETKQTRVGVGLNRGGCTLMNPTRLKTVASFENVFTVKDEK